MKEQLPIRKSPRLARHDYSCIGAYFITLCVKDRHEMLGKIVGAGSSRPQVELSDCGIIVQKWIDKVTDKYPKIRIENSIIMPNHVHMILSILPKASNEEFRSNDVGIVYSGRDDPAPTELNVEDVRSFMGYFKYQTTKEINIPGFWQRSYHDHIIRDKAEYERIYKYISENPARWNDDVYYIKNP